jgi:hypothetical protein
MFTVSFGTSAMACSVWSSSGEARAGSFADLDIANEYGSGSGPVYVFSQADVGGEGKQSSGVGIQMDSEFESPTILGSEWGGARWIGCNSHLYRISPNMVIEHEIGLDSRFDSFRLISRLNRLIILTEVGLFSVCDSGEIGWRVDLDVITDACWESESVVISQMDGSGVRVELESGSTAPL